MARTPQRRKKQWSFKSGKRATQTRPSSLVRAYERKDRPGLICPTQAWETTDSGRPKEEILRPGTTREEDGPEDRHVVALRRQIQGPGTSDRISEEARGAGEAP